MKNLALWTIIVMAFFGFATAQAGGKDEAVIKFESFSHDFGTISEEGGKVTCEFEFTNTGKAPLVIISANASCGCTKPEIPQEPVSPGKTGKITVSYNPKGRPGEFTKNITVRTNSPKNKKVILKITGVVVPSSPKK